VAPWSVGFGSVAFPSANYSRRRINFLMTRNNFATYEAGRSPEN
jgi:hypothetical protein